MLKKQNFIGLLRHLEMCKTHEIHNIFEDNELLCKQINIHCGILEQLLIYFRIEYLIEERTKMKKNI